MKTEEEIKEAEEQIQEAKEPVSYDTREYPVEVLVNKFIEGEFKVPGYQREFIWKSDVTKMSKFIESILLDLPIAYLFFADEPEDGKLEVVDGSQRLRTLCSFYKNEFELSGLETLDKLNGFRYEDLLESRKRRFLRKTLRSIELTEKASSDIRQDLFARINSNPFGLNPMEVRKGSLSGRFMDFVLECSLNEDFIELCPISQTRRDRQEGPELILRYFAYSDRYESFVHSVEDFVDDFVKEKIQSFDEPTLNSEYLDMLTFVKTYFENGFRKGKNHKSTPRVRFESISVGVTLALRIDPNLTPSDVTVWLNSDEFKKHTTSDASNSKIKVKERIEFVRDKLLGRI